MAETMVVVNNEKQPAQLVYPASVLASTKGGFNYNNTKTLATPGNKTVVASFRNTSSSSPLISAHLILSDFASTNEGILRVLMYRNAVFTNTPTWVDVNSNSVIEYSLDSTITFPTLPDLAFFVNASGGPSTVVQGGKNLDLTNLGMYLSKDENITIAVERVTGSTSNPVFMYSFNWIETNGEW